MQFSKCSVCGKDEKYIRFVGSVEVAGCRDMCHRKDDEPKTVIARDHGRGEFVGNGVLDASA